MCFFCESAARRIFFFIIDSIINGNDNDNNGASSTFIFSRESPDSFARHKSTTRVGSWQKLNRFEKKERERELEREKAIFLFFLFFWFLEDGSPIISWFQFSRDRERKNETLAFICSETETGYNYLASGEPSFAPRRAVQYVSGNISVYGRGGCKEALTKEEPFITPAAVEPGHHFNLWVTNTKL